VAGKTSSLKKPQRLGLLILGIYILLDFGIVEYEKRTSKNRYDQIIERGYGV
jgi:hypothetical protein